MAEKMRATGRPVVMLEPLDPKVRLKYIQYYFFFVLHQIKNFCEVSVAEYSF